MKTVAKSLARIMINLYQIVFAAPQKFVQISSTYNKNSGDHIFYNKRALCLFNFEALRHGV